MVTVLDTLTEEDLARRNELLSRPEYRDLYPWRNAKAESAPESKQGGADPSDKENAT